MIKDSKTVFRKDVQLCMVTWTALEVLCFWVFPLTRAFTYEQVGDWFLVSILIGPIGSVIVAYSSSLVVASERMPDPKSKERQRWVAKILSLVGLLGLLFPLGLAGIIFAQEVRATDWENLFQDTSPLDQSIYD